MTQNKNCQINFEKTEYKALRYDCLDLLKRMLEKDPEKRISAKDCLNHCFLNRSSNAQNCETDETLGMPLCDTLKKYNEEYIPFLSFIFFFRKKFNFDKVNVFMLSPSKSPMHNNHNNNDSPSRILKNKSRETFFGENATSKGSFRAEDSCISFVMRSPIFGDDGNDSVEEMNNNFGSNMKMNSNANVTESIKKHNLIKRNNSHFNTIMSKISDFNMTQEEIPHKKLTIKK